LWKADDFDIRCDGGPEGVGGAAGGGVWVPVCCFFRREIKAKNFDSRDRRIANQHRVWVDGARVFESIGEDPGAGGKKKGRSSLKERVYVGGGTFYMNGSAGEMDGGRVSVGGFSI